MEEPVNNNEVNVNSVPTKVWMIGGYSHSQLMKALVHEALANGDIVVTSHCKESEDLSLQYQDKLLVVHLDPRDRSLTHSAVAKAVRAFGRIDVLVNHEPFIVIDSVEDLSEALLRDQLHQSFSSCVSMIHATLPQFFKQKSGHIINVTDVCGAIGTPALSAWTAAIRAIEGYTESLALSLVGLNIKTTVVRTSLEVSLASMSARYHSQGKSSLESVNISAGRQHSLVQETSAALRNFSIFPTEDFDQAVSGIISIAGHKDPPSFLPASSATVDQIRQFLSTYSESLDEYADHVEEEYI